MLPADDFVAARTAFHAAGEERFRAKRSCQSALIDGSWLWVAGGSGAGRRWPVRRVGKALEEWRVFFRHAVAKVFFIRVWRHVQPVPAVVEWCMETS